MDASLPLSHSMLTVLNGISTVVFAMTGVVAVRGRGFDVFGVMVVALVTAVGGGTMRDMMLGVRAFWLMEPMYLLLPVAAALGGFLVSRRKWLDSKWILPVLDAVGLALFTVLGTRKAILHEVPLPCCIALGIVTGVGGGLLRDIIANRIPLLLRREVYATAALAGAAIVVAVGGREGMLAGFWVCLAIRLAAIYWNLSLPTLPRTETR